MKESKRELLSCIVGNIDSQCFIKEEEYIEHLVVKVEVMNCQNFEVFYSNTSPLISI